MKLLILVVSIIVCKNLSGSEAKTAAVDKSDKKTLLDKFCDDLEKL